MHVIGARSRARRTLGVLTVAGLLGLTGVMATSARPASAGPLAVSSLTATDQFGKAASVVWTTEPVTLTVTANANVGGDTLRIVDLNAVPTNPVGTPCTHQQSCSASGISFSTAGTHTFEGQLLAGSTVLSTFDISVTWSDSLGPTLTASQTTVPTGQAVTLTATVSRDLEFSAWFLGIYDDTTGARLCAIGSGTSCAGTISESAATTHQFTAFVGNNAPTQAQLTAIRNGSPSWWVTWSNDGWQISLKAAPAITLNGENTNVTATANMNVGNSPILFIQVYDERNGQRIGECGTGTVCSFSFTPSFAGDGSGDNLIAFVAPDTPVLPGTGSTLGGFEASSSVVFTETIAG
jgi:hypothetical protein